MHCDGVWDCSWRTELHIRYDRAKLLPKLHKTQGVVYNTYMYMLEEEIDVLASSVVARCVLPQVGRGRVTYAGLRVWHCTAE